MMDKIKKFENKKICIIIAILSVVVFITLFKLVIKDTHAYYNSVTDPVQIFNGKVGNFKPRIDIFYIKEKNGQPKYTNVSSNTVYITPGNNNSNLEQVCITETDDISTCDNKWQPIQSTNQYSYTFPDVTEGPKVIFGFVKDKYGNKSLSSSDTITYDVTPPTITSVQATNIQETSVTLTVTANDNYSGINQYCYSQNSSDIGTCVTSSDGNITINNLQDGQSYTYYIYLTDNVGNSGISSKTSHTFETKSSGIRGQDLIDNRKNIPNLQDTPVDGLYRYYGTKDQVTNNYICLGASENPDVCKNDPENMYRIIGVTTDGKLKVIKAKKYGANQAWHGTPSSVGWNASTLYTYLNDTFYNSINDRIKILIEYHIWNMELTQSLPGTTTGNQDGTVNFKFLTTKNLKIKLT